MPEKLRKPRLQAFERQHGRCCYCRRPMWLTDRNEFARRHGLTPAQAEQCRATAEHRIARCDGGNDHAGNIDAACLFCNRRRHSRSIALPAELFTQHVQARIERGRWRRF